MLSARWRRVNIALRMRTRPLIEARPVSRHPSITDTFEQVSVIWNRKKA
jgi:hypothetical protein